MPARKTPDDLHDTGNRSGSYSSDQRTFYSADADGTDQQFLPLSFLAVYLDARQRRTAPMATVRSRYDWCEDLAQTLVEQLQRLHIDGADEERVALLRVLEGLRLPDAGLAPGEAEWVVRRLAELVGWRHPEPSDSGGDSRDRDAASPLL